MAFAKICFYFGPLVCVPVFMPVFIPCCFWLIESVVHFEIKYYDVNLVFVNLKLSTMMANWSSLHELIIIFHGSV